MRSLEETPMSHRSRAWLSLVVALTLVLAACSGTATDTTAGESPDSTTGVEAPKSLVVAYQADIASFDPDNNFEVAGLGAINAVYEGLVEYSPDSTDVVGLLASDWTVSDDGLVYTFTIREGVTFHDGTPMTASDVKASLERRWSDDTLLLWYFLFNVASLEAPDDTTLVMTLIDPQPSMLDNLASPWGPKIMSPTALAANAGDDNGKSYFNENAVGTGPMQLVEFSRGQRYVLERFDDYWGDVAPMDQIVIQIVPEISQQILQLQSGQLDAVLHGYPFEQLDSLPDGLEVSAYNDLGLEMAYVNPNKNLATPELRQAVVAAMNPNTWVADVFGDFAAPARSLFPIAMLPDAPEITWPTAPDGVDVPPIEIWYSTEEEGVQKRVADILIARMAEAGITATARSVPATQIQSIPNDPDSAPDIVLAQNNPDSAHPDAQAFLFFASIGPLNILGYNNPDADDLIFSAAGLTDPGEASTAYLAISDFLLADGAFVPLADIQDVIVYRSDLAGIVTRPAIPWTFDFGTISR